MARRLGRLVLLALVVLVLALIAYRPLLRSGNPWLAAVCADDVGDPEDPWGQGWLSTPRALEVDARGKAAYLEHRYSAGPDGRDDQRAGDDIEVHASGNPVLGGAIMTFYDVPAEGIALWRGASTLGLVLAGLVGVWLGVLLRPPRRRGAAAEVLAVLALALSSALAALGAVHALLGTRLVERVVVPAGAIVPWAVPVEPTVVLGWLVVAVAARSRAATRDPGVEAAESTPSTAAAPAVAA